MNEAQAARLNIAAFVAAAPRHRLPSRRRGRPRGAGGRRHRQPDRAVLRGALHHPAGLAARRRGGAAGGPGAIRAERRPRRVPRRRGQSEPTRSASSQADPKADRSKPAWLHRARAGAPAALRRALDAGGGGREGGTPGRRRIRSASACATAASCRCRPGAAATRSRHRPQRRRLRQGGRGPTGKTGHPRRAARPADGAGRGGGAGEQDRPRAGHGRRLLLSAEPAQPRDAVAPAARLLVQADDLSRGAERTACSPTR